MVKVGDYGWCLGNGFGLCLGEHGDEHQAMEKLPLIQNMMYLPKVYAKTQFKSESLKPRDSTINENLKEWYVISSL